MRKIDKSVRLANLYFEWLAKGENHGEYSSSKSLYYKEIVMNLLYCQQGLCAYTERSLCSEESIQMDSWEKGKYIGDYPQHGQLDHFDPLLKKPKAWMWGNFFVIDSDVNVKIKRNQRVDDILKPDREGYSPFDLLAYDADLHLFIPRVQLAKEIQERIKAMIKILGINWEPIVDERRKYLQEKIFQERLGLSEFEEMEVDQFPTAFEMIKQKNR